MIVFREVRTEAEASATVPHRSLTLPFQKRRLSRQRATLDDGECVALLLPRGSVLQDGSVLRGDDGRFVRVRAAAECVSQVASGDLLLLTRAAYHLGNRHICVQVEMGRLSYLHDHVLDDLVRGLGLDVTVTNAPFEPESGAYGSHGHHHVGHEHGHSHDPGHAHHGHHDRETPP